MRNVLLSTVLFMGIISVHAQNKVSINNQNMEKKTSAVRLIILSGKVALLLIGCRTSLLKMLREDIIWEHNC